MDEPPPLRHPGMAAQRREKVTDLARALAYHGTRSEVADAIRGLIASSSSRLAGVLKAHVVRRILAWAHQHGSVLVTNDLDSSAILAAGPR